MPGRRLLGPVWLITRLLLPLALLAGVGGAIFYVRLLNGPISLKPIAAPIARAIAADLPGLDVTIEDASVVLSEGRGLEFRLRNVKLADARGATVAHAPDAAVTLSTTALWSGRIAPSRIILIEPSLVLQHSRERGLSLSFAEGPGPAPAIAAPAAPTGAGHGGVGAQGDLGATLGAMLAQVGQSAGAASYIRGIGLRSATLTIEGAGGQRTVLQVREADVGVDRRGQGSLLGANLSIESARGPWQLTLVASREEATSAIAIDARIADLVPSAIAGAGLTLAPLAAVDLPVRGTAAIKLGGTGVLESALVELDLGRGAIAPGWRGNGRLPVEGGRISLSYEPAARRLALATSRLHSGSSWATFAGSIGFAAEPGRPWQVDIAAREGQLAAEEFGQGPQPLEAFHVRGLFDPSTGNLELAEALIRAAGGEISMKGLVPGKGSGALLRLEGRMEPMSVSAIKLLWPSVIAPNARQWSGRNILQGRLTEGKFKIEEMGTPAERARYTPDGVRVMLTIEGTGVRIQPKPGLAPVEAQRVLVRLDGNVLEVAAPEAVVHTTVQRRLPIRGVRMVSSDVDSPTAFGDLTFRAQGPLPAALDLAEQQAARNGRPLVLPGEGLDGRIDAQVRIQVPLGDDVTADDTRLDIKGRVNEGRARGIFGSWDVTGSALQFELTDQQLDTRGEIVVGGVSAKVALKRIFAAPDGEQPPIHISANLDNSERTQLGLDINDLVIGEMPVEILVSPRVQQDSQIQVRANLTNAELAIEPLAWRKPKGRPATLQFEIVRPSRQRTELQGFRIVGEDISLSGSLVMDGRNRLREFSFHELSLHVVSRLQLAGTLRNDNIWDVNVRGQTLDGRAFFTSLFSVNQARAKQAPARKDQTGLDLRVEIDNVLGHQDLSLKGLRMQVSNRAGRVLALQARGTVDGTGRGAGNPIEATITTPPGEARRLRVRTDDAGQAFRMIGFFPNMLGGSMSLDVFLDGSGDAEKTGRLYVERFAILGDPLPNDALGDPGGRGQRRAERSRLDFDSMRAPFRLGHGQVVIEDADLRGQVLGVVVTGKADYVSQYVHLEGTYVPLQGLNSAIGYFPILGIILAGPRGEGVIGMKFEVRGPMSRPQISVNPVSVLPGILREMTKFSNPDLRIRPREEQPAPPPPGKAPPASKASPASKAPPAKKVPPVKASSTASGSGKSRTATTPPAQIEADGGGGWTSTPPAPARPAAKQ